MLPDIFSERPKVPSANNIKGSHKVNYPSINFHPKIQWQRFEELISDVFDEYAETVGIGREDLKDSVESFKSIIATNSTLKALVEPLQVLETKLSKGVSSERHVISDKIRETIAILFQISIFDLGVARVYERETVEILDIRQKIKDENSLVISDEPIDYIPQVLTLKRAGFVAECQEILKNIKPTEDFEILLYDVRGMKGINNFKGDMSSDMLGSINGDAAIQLGNLVVQNAVRYIKDTLGEDSEIIVTQCKYAGDEMLVTIKCPNFVDQEGEPLIKKIEAKITNYIQEQAKDYSLNTTDENNITTRTDLIVKAPEIYSLPELTKKNEEARKIFITAVSSTGLLLDDKQIQMLIDNKQSLETFYKHNQYTQTTHNSLLDQINSSSDAELVSLIAKLSRENAIFDYFFNKMSLYEVKLNSKYPASQDGIKQKNLELGLPESTSFFELSRRTLQAFVPFLFDAIFGEVIADASLMSKLLASGNLHSIVEISNQIKGINFVSMVDGDNVINRSTKHAIIAATNPELVDNLSDPNNLNEYNKQLLMSPREILAASKKFSQEDLKTIGFGKKGPDTYIYATRYASEKVKDFIKSLSQIKKIPILDPSGKSELVYIETGIKLTENVNHTKFNFKEFVGSAKSEWAKNVAQTIIHLNSEDTDILKDIITNFPINESLETQKEYNYLQYKQNPKLANIAFSFQAWTNRKLENVNAILTELEMSIGMINIDHQTLRFTISLTNTIKNLLPFLKELRNRYKNNK